MKIIDFHTHFYPEKIAARALQSVAGLPGVTPATDGTAEGLAASMRCCGIEGAVGLSLVNTPVNSRGVNHWAAGWNRAPFFMTGSFHPEEPDPAATVVQAAALGLKGIKVHPEYQRFRFADKRLYPAWEACIEKELFVVTHAGADFSFQPPYRTGPSELAAFHRRFPQLKLVLAHFGSMDMWDAVEQELIGLPVYLDTAFVAGRLAPDRLTAMIRRHGAEWVLFGSDSPWADQRAAIDYLDSLDLTQSEREAIFYRNAARLLQLPV